MYVNYTRPNISTVTVTSGESFTFIPGINEIDGALWAKLIANKYFKRDLDAGVYKVETEDDDDDVGGGSSGPGNVQPQPPAPLARVTDDQTTRLISQTYDIKTLKEMKRNETRRQVIDQIDEQITKLQEERRNNRGRANTEED